MKKLGLITIFLCGAVLFFFTGDFTPWGALDSPTSTYLSPYYIEKSMGDTAVPNLVTSVLADYRGYDTMFETAVVFAAGLACFFLLRIPENKNPPARFYRHIATDMIFRVEKGGKIPDHSDHFERIDSVWTPYDVIIKHTCRLVIPFIQIFALYVVAHGHHSPGGGFQGGVLLGASMILFAISHDLRATLRRLGERATGVFSATGVLIYAGTGALCMLLGSNFLDYGALGPLLGVDKVMARSHGILLVEIGVAMAVMSVMVWIYYSLSSAGKHDEGL